jgi:hypothetical protein
MDADRDRRIRVALRAAEVDPVHRMAVDLEELRRRP